MLIRIRNLHTRTIIGIRDWERQRPQEVVLNLEIEFDGSAAAASDRIEDTIDYRALKLRVLEAVEASRFGLLEKLASHILEIVMEEPRVERARVEVAKPGALRFADGVAVGVEQSRNEPRSASTS